MTTTGLPHTVNLRLCPSSFWYLHLFLLAIKLLRQWTSSTCKACGLVFYLGILPRNIDMALFAIGIVAECLQTSIPTKSNTSIILIASIAALVRKTSLFLCPSPSTIPTSIGKSIQDTFTLYRTTIRMVEVLIVLGITFRISHALLLASAL